MHSDTQYTIHMKFQCSIPMESRYYEVILSVRQVKTTIDITMEILCIMDQNCHYQKKLPSWAEA